MPPCRDETLTIWFLPVQRLLELLQAFQSQLWQKGDGLGDIRVNTAVLSAFFPNTVEVDAQMLVGDSGSIRKQKIPAVACRDSYPIRESDPENRARSKIRSCAERGA